MSTTRMARSHMEEPRLRRLLNDSWPGVSMMSRPGSLISVLTNCWRGEGRGGGRGGEGRGGEGRGGEERRGEGRGGEGGEGRGGEGRGGEGGSV